MSGDGNRIEPGTGLEVADDKVAATVTVDLARAVDILNEAARLDPRFWSLFDVMVPTANIVGHATPIELMQVNDRIAMAGVLGVINGLLGDGTQRISIIMESENGIAKRRFVATELDFHNVDAPALPTESGLVPQTDGDSPVAHDEE